MKYLVSVAGREVEVEIDGERVIAAGREYTASLTGVPGTPLRQLLLSGRPTGMAMEDGGRGLGRRCLTPWFIPRAPT